MTDDRQSDTPPPPGAASVSPDDPGSSRDAGVGTGKGYSGDEYDAAGHAAERNLEGRMTPRDHHAGDPDDGRDLPPEVGKRAWIDEKTGEVHGSGAGAGGGNPVEDYDSDEQAGG